MKWHFQRSLLIHSVECTQHSNLFPAVERYKKKNKIHLTGCILSQHYILKLSKCDNKYSFLIKKGLSFQKVLKDCSKRSS